MTTHLSLRSLVYFIGILIFAAADDLVLPALTLENGPNDFLPQQPQTNNTVPADVSQNENSKTHAFKEEQDNVDEENDSSKPDTDTSDTFGERGGLLDLPVAIVSSNLTSQPVDSVATSTSESPQEQEDTEPSNKDISNSELIIGAKSGQPKNSVTIDNEDGGQLGQNNDTEISDSNSTLNDFHGKNVTANYSPWSQEDKLPVPPFDVLHLSDLTENGNLERFVHNETVDITTAEIDNTSAGIKDSDLLHTDGLNESSSSNQSGQEHVHGDSQYSLQYLLQQQQRLLSHQFQPQKQSSNQTDTAMLPDSHSQLGNQQHAHVEHAELPLPPTYNAELPVGKKGLSRQYHPQQQHQEQKGQLLELPRLPVYQDSPKEQQQQEQKEQPIELPKLPLYQNDVKEQQPLELPKPPLYQNDVKEQQPLELPKPPLYQNDVKEQQPLELPKPPLYPYGVKEQQQQLQPTELPKLPVYQYNPQKQQNQKEQTLELPKLTLYGDTQQEQIPQPQGNKYGQAELSQLPKEIAKLAGDMQKLPEVSQANGATSSDEGDSTDYSETGGSMMSSDENEYQSDYNPPVGPLGKQADTDYRQKSKWKSVYKVNNKGQDEWYKEATNDEGYYDEDGKAGEELKNNHWEGDKADGDEAYVNQESTYSDEEEPDDTKKTHAGDHDSGTPWDVDNSEDDDQDDLNGDKIHLVEDVVDEDLASRSRLPTAPTSMVVFYTWMIVAVLIFVVGISMYQSHCHGSRFRLPGSKPSSSGSDRKRLLDHEFV